VSCIFHLSHPLDMEILQCRICLGLHLHVQIKITSTIPVHRTYVICAMRVDTMTLSLLPGTKALAEESELSVTSRMVLKGL